MAKVWIYQNFSEIHVFLQSSLVIVEVSSCVYMARLTQNREWKQRILLAINNIICCAAAGKQDWPGLRAQKICIVPVDQNFCPIVTGFGKPWRMHNQCEDITTKLHFVNMISSNTLKVKL